MGQPDKIIVRDEARCEIGTTFPKRAKQLVIKSRAEWLDEAHTEIILFPETKAKLLPSEEQTSGGKTMDHAAASEIGDAGAKARRRSLMSLVMDAYRDSEERVLDSSPIEIIKKSRKRTRELHTAFSVVLWVGVALIYLGCNMLIGNTAFTLNPSEWSSNWLVFVVAAFIECGAEIFFCKKELDVLNENIDLRQINPNNDDLDLRGYQKRLIRKIRVMSSATVWIPILMLFLICGYVFGMWNLPWILFLCLSGIFFELVLGFVRKLKKK